MNRRRLICTVVAMLAVPQAGLAQGSIMVMNAVVRPPLVANIKTGALYVMLMNHGSEADKLISITTPVAASVELHQTVEKDGVVSMPVVEGVALAAGGMAELKTGAMHGMINGLNVDLKPGDTVPFIFHFEKAGDVPVTATVDAVGMSHEHSHEGSSN